MASAGPSDDKIKVAIRCRPILPTTEKPGPKKLWICTDKTITTDSSQTTPASYTFDHIFDDSASNKMIFDELAAAIVTRAMQGFNGTIFSYGQSGSGKTYTMDGIRTMAIDSLFEYIDECPTEAFTIRAYYIELYNEQLSDLLSDVSTPLTIFQDKDKNVSIRGLTEITILSKDHLKEVLTQGNARRTIAETKLNNKSSRAHCIFHMLIEHRAREDRDSPVYVAHLNLVDLAGSEKAGANTGERFREGVSINLSLFTLSTVIRQLSSGQGKVISYRNSILTRILQPALEGNSTTAIVCTITPSSLEESHSTLRFASNAKQVKTTPQQNIDMTESALLKKLQLKVVVLENIIKELTGIMGQSDLLERCTKEKDDAVREMNRSVLVSTKKPKKVCAPKMDTRIPKAARKLVLQPTQSIEVEIHSIPEPHAMDDIRPSHSRDSPPISEEHSDSNMPLTDIEKDRLLQSYKAQMKKKDDKIEDLERKLRQRSGLYLIHRDTIEEAEVEKCDAAVQVDMAETSGCQQEESICERCLMHEETNRQLEQENQTLKAQMQEEAVDSEEESICERCLMHEETNRQLEQENQTLKAQMQEEAVDSEEEITDDAEEITDEVAPAEVEEEAGRAGRRVNKLGRSYVSGRPLSDGLRNTIIRLADQGVSPIEISRTLKVTKGCISKTLKRLRQRRR